MYAFLTMFYNRERGGGRSDFLKVSLRTKSIKYYKTYKMKYYKTY